MPLKHRPRSDTPVTVYVDGLLLAHLLSQQGISDEGVIPEIIARKLTQAAGRLVDCSAADLAWRPVGRSARPVSVPLTDRVRRALADHAARLGFTEEVLIATVLYDDTFAGHEPTDEPAGAQLQLGYLRTEPGRGRIYGMYFEMPGYQYAFLRSLGHDAFSAREILDVAFVQLAKAVCSRSNLGGIVASPEALTFARKMLNMAGGKVRTQRSCRRTSISASRHPRE